MNRSAKNEYVRKLVEQYGPRETFRSLAAKILPPEPTQELRPLSKVPAEPQKIILNKQILRKMRTRPRGPITLPSQEEALYWLRRWQQRWDKNSNELEG